MSGRNPAQQQRSSADLYASIPLSDGAYPPIRSITPQTPQVVSPTYAQHPPQPQRPPSYLGDHGRTPSTASDFSARDPFRASMPNSRPGTATGGAYDPPASSNDYPHHGGEMSGRYSPSDRGSVNGGIGSGSTDWGSSANLNQIMYRNGPPGAQAGRSDSYLGDKEVLAGGGTGPRDGTLRKKNYAAATGDYDPLGGPRRTGPGGGGLGGWWSRKSTLAKWLLALGALLVVIAAIAIPVGIVKSRDSSDSANKVNAAAPAATSSTSANDGTEEGIPTAATPVANWQTAPYGGNGSVVFLQDGSNFTYLNSFGESTILSFPLCFRRIAG